MFLGQYTEGMRAGQAKVSKIFKDGTEAYEDQFFDQDVTLCTESIKIVNAFNQGKKFGSFVKVCKASVWHMTRSKQRILVEPFLSNFQNFNSNTGWQGSSNWSEALQSLSHFSYHHSQGDLVLCDLQGAVEDGEVVLTDRVISSKDKRFGPTDPWACFGSNLKLRIWGRKASRTSFITTSAASGATLLGPNLDRPMRTSSRRQGPR